VFKSVKRLNKKTFAVAGQSPPQNPQVSWRKIPIALIAPPEGVLSVIADYNSYGAGWPNVCKNGDRQACSGAKVNVVAVFGLFLLGFWVMAAGGIVGSAVHQMPSIGVSILGCIVSTVGLGLCLSRLALAKSRLAIRLAEVLSFFAILYGLFHSLTNIIFQHQFTGTLIYGIYMAGISIVAVLVVRRADMRLTRL
jgi:hypothetical protein